MSAEKLQRVEAVRAMQREGEDAIRQQKEALHSHTREMRKKGQSETRGSVGRGRLFVHGMVSFFVELKETEVRDEVAIRVTGAAGTGDPSFGLRFALDDRWLTLLVVLGPRGSGGRLAASAHETRAPGPKVGATALVTTSLL